MAKKPRRRRVVPSLSVRLCLLRGMDLTAAGMLFGLATQFGCDVTVSTDAGSVDAAKLLDVVGLNIQPQKSVTLTITGPERNDLAERLRRAGRERWFVESVKESESPS